MTRRTQYEHKAIFSGDSRGVVRASAQASAAVSKFASQESNAAKAINRYNASVQNSTKLTRNLTRVVGGFSLAAVAAEFTRTADAMTLLEGRLSLVTGSTRELEATQAELFSLAQNSRADLEAFTSFYVRLAQRLGTASRNGLELTEVTELVSKSLTIGGATAKETSASLLQLSQALSSGLLRGDEFRSLSENALGLMQAIADGAGVTQAKLREMSIAGELTTEFILNALNESAPQIRAQFDSLPITFGQAIQQIRNIAVQGVADLNNEFNITGTLVDVVGALANNLDLVGAALGGIVALKVAKSLGQMHLSLLKATAATKNATIATNLETDAVRRGSLAKVGAARDAFRLAAEKAKAAEGSKRHGVALELERQSLKKLSLARREHLALMAGSTAATNAATEATKRATFAATAASRAYAFLGGPLGIGLLIAQGIAAAAMFTDFSDEVELSARSVDQLNESVSKLNGKTFESLKASEQAALQEIKWRSEISSTNEANNQRLEVLNRYLVALRENIVLTKQGREEYESDLRAKKSLLHIEEARLKMDLQRQPNDVARMLVLKDLIKLDEELALVKGELNRIEVENEAQRNKARKAFVESLKVTSSAITLNESLINSLRSKADAYAQEKVELQELKDIQQNHNFVEGESAEFKQVLEERIKSLTKSIEGNTKSTNNNKNVVEQLIERDQKLTEQIKLLEEAHRRTGKETSKFSIEAERLAKSQESLNGVVKTAVEKADELAQKYQNKELTVKQLESALKRLGLTQAQYNVIMERTGAGAVRAEQAVAELLKDMERQIEVQRETAASGESVAEVYDLLEKAAKAAGLSVTELIAQFPELKKKFEDFVKTREGIKEYNENLRELSSTLADAIVSGESLADSFKALWKRMVRDFLESGFLKLLRSIPSALKGGSLDFSGFNPVSAISSLFSSGSSALTAAEIAQGSAANLAQLGISSGTATAGTGVFASISSAASTAFGAVKAAGSSLLAGGKAIIAAIPGWGQAALAAAALFAGVRELFGGGARSFSEIVREDYLKDLLGSQGPNEAVGLNGAIGFNGGNTAIFGANFGIAGSGLNSQLLVDGGENGNGGFFTGAQSSLDAFGELARQNGFRVDQANGVLRVLSFDKTKDDIIDLWRTFNDGLEGAVAFSEIFATATKNNLIKPTNLFFENFALGFGQSAFEARDAIIAIDREFDSLVASGANASDALLTAISNFYNISVDNAREFVDKSGVSIAQWVANLSNASDEALRKMLDFNAQGRTEFESAVEGYRTSIQGLSGILNSVDLGKLNIPTPDPINIPIATSSASTSTVAPSLGTFNSALNQSRVVNVPSVSAAPTLRGGDQLHTVGLNSREQFGVTKKGTFERIERKLDLVVSNPQSDSSDLKEDVRQLTKAVKDLMRITQARN